MGVMAIRRVEGGVAFRARWQSGGLKAGWRLGRDGNQASPPPPPLARVEGGVAIRARWQSGGLKAGWRFRHGPRTTAST